MLGHILRNNPREIYRAEVTDEGINFTVRPALVDDIVKTVTRDEFITPFLAIKRSCNEREITFSITLPYITFPNITHKKLDWKALGVCAEQVNLLLYILNTYGDKGMPEEYFLSSGSQLMLIGTGYSKERDMHACPMELGFSEAVSRKLVPFTKKEMLCETVIKKASLAYLRLTASTKKEFEKNKKEFEGMHGGLFGVTVKIRDSGVPQFSVPGNCACLGENPDTFSYSRDMYSHNLDTTLQQMTMLVAAITFWNDVLKPLEKSLIQEQ